LSVREKLYVVIFEADTPAGKAFDVALIISVLLSVLAVMLGTVKSVEAQAAGMLRGVEWFFTGLFTLEYLLRLYSAKSARRYARSFLGAVDLVAVLPTYLGLIMPGSHVLMTVRVVRVLRVFRVFKLAAYIEEAGQMVAALKASGRRIAVFLLGVFTMVIVLGSLMYAIEGGAGNPGFSSIPTSIYWAVVTLTTVGYGDIAPHSAIGQAIAALIMIMGYSLIVVPTGFVSVAIATERRAEPGPAPECPSCSKPGHESGSAFCRHCGSKLKE